MNQARNFEDKEFGRCEVLYFSDALAQEKQLCIFASHTFSPQLPEYIYYWLEEVRKAGIGIVFISTAKLARKDLEKLSGFSLAVIERENKGTDFGSWCSVIRNMELNEDLDFLYLCNDSVFGPFLPFSVLHSKFQEASEPVMGITDSYQGVAYHIQSYFVGLKKEVLRSKVWSDFWQNLSIFSERQKIIEHYEIGFSIALKKAGYEFFIWSNWSKSSSYDSLIQKVCASASLRSRWLNRLLSYRDDFIGDINPCAFLWKELIGQFGSPILKRELLIYQHLFEEYELLDQWQETLCRFPKVHTNLIKFFLVDYFLHRTLPLTFPSVSNLSFSFTGSSAKRTWISNALRKEHDIGFLDYIHALGFSDNNEGVKTENKIDTNSLGVAFLEGRVKYEGKTYAPITFVHLSENILSISQSDSFLIKTRIKQASYPIVIVANEAVMSFVSSVLHLKETGILLENEIYFPVNKGKIATIFESIFQTTSITLSNPFIRPSISSIVSDAVKQTNRTGFLRQASSSLALNMHLFDESKLVWLNDAERYKLLQQRYFQIYECTPKWYKVVGHLLKLATGRKKLKLAFVDKGSKLRYEPTVEDLSLWYHQQYEVLPEWYKSVGKWVVKRRQDV